MTKKKVVSTLAAATLAVTSSMTAFAGAATPVPEWGTNGGQSEVTGDSWTVQPVIEVELPAELTFGVNPMKLDADGDSNTANDNTQILSTDYLIINRSNVPVDIKAETKVKSNSVEEAAGKDAIEFLSTVAASNFDSVTKELDNTTGKRSVLLIQQLPTGPATVGSDEAVTMAYTKPDWGTDTPANSGIFGCALGTTANEIHFLLDANNGTLAAGNVSGFTFSGAVNPNTEFYDGEITVTTVFTCNIVTTAQMGDTNKYEKSKISSATTGAGSETGYDTTIAVKK